ncbi:MAG: acyl-CoA desaturase [Spirochaetales bacterium]|nr:acyl-CoA desaturase [Leptospiraceae bacterium]MCP5481608.1 acyl-CoA desaturase [Spirochaetales bacterium]MCP5484436.1 acyl-CoA desaturase [Spirochaetales bacterium]
MTIILSFFVAHWILSVFSQTFFLHRYGAHRMFSMSPGWERFWHLFTIVAQGPSFLHPRGYAILHRMHHAYSDTEKDPHSPHHAKGFVDMMLKTKERYDSFAYNRVEVPREFDLPAPSWPVVDRMTQTWWYRVGTGALYALFYIAFVPEGQWGWFLLLPVHWLMGPIHGAIVNWGGHMYGYVNHPKTKDQSRNTLPVDFLTLGELFQNNHHGMGTSPNFAYRWFEIDPAYQVMRLFQWVGMIQIEGKPAARKADPGRLAA